MAFKLKRRPINIFCCRLDCNNMRHTLRFAVRSLNTSVAPYLTSFNICINHTYNPCSILHSKYFTGTSLLTFYPLGTWFIILLVLFFWNFNVYPPSLYLPIFLTFTCIQLKVFFGLRSLKCKLEISTSHIAPK